MSQNTDYMQDDFYEYMNNRLRYRGITLKDMCEGIIDTDKLYKYIEGGFAKKSGNRYFLTPRGMYVSNYILSDVLDFDGSMAAGAAEGMVQ